MLHPYPNMLHPYPNMLHPYPNSMQIRWHPLLGVLPSEPIVLGLGLAMFLISIQP